MKPHPMRKPGGQAVSFSLPPRGAPGGAPTLQPALNAAKDLKFDEIHTLRVPLI